LRENQHLRSLADYALHLKQLHPYLCALPLASVHRGMLRPFIEARQKQGRKATSINLPLGLVRHILDMAAPEWLDEDNLTSLATPPKIKLLKVTEAAEPTRCRGTNRRDCFSNCRNTWPHVVVEGQHRLSRCEVCGLKWAWEVSVPELDTSVFLIPGAKVKNGDERLVVLNRVAKSVIDSVRGENDEYVFVYRGRPIGTMNNNGWQEARKRVGLTQVRMHDLKHTFGRRLRAAGVSFEDRQDLLGHPSGRITTHYSAAELANLIDAANRVRESSDRKMPTLVMLKQKAPAPVAASA